MKSKLSKIAFNIFLISLIYYVIWIIYFIYLYFHGVNPDWFISSLSDHEMIYGWKAVDNGFDKFLTYTFLIFWIVPLYQLIYLISTGIRKVLNKNKEAKIEK